MNVLAIGPYHGDQAGNRRNKSTTPAMHRFGGLQPKLKHGTLQKPRVRSTPPGRQTAEFPFFISGFEVYTRWTVGRGWGVRALLPNPTTYAKDKSVIRPLRRRGR